MTFNRDNVDYDLREYLGDADEKLGVDGEQSGTDKVDAFFQQLESEAVIKATTAGPDNNFLIAHSGDLSTILTSDAPQSEFLKSDSPAFVIPPPAQESTGGTIVLPVKEKSAAFREAQNKFIKVSRWLRDRLNKIAAPDEQQSSELQKLWTRVFGFSSDRLNDDADAREAVGQMVTNVSVRLIQEELADQKV